MMKQVKKGLLLLLSFVLVSTLLLGCIKSEDVSTNEPKVLKIYGGWGDDNYLRRDWTDYYELTHPNVTFEFTPMHEPGNPQGTDPSQAESPFDRMKRILSEDNAPDIILLDNNLQMLTQLVEEGLVLPLDTFIEKSKYDLDAVIPMVKETIKELGDGKSMYALVPSFSSSALFYNKNLFDKYGIPYPTDNMTWQEVHELAKRFPTEDGSKKIYGLFSQDYSGWYHFMSTFASPLGLQLVDSEGKTIRVNTPEWEKAISDYVAMCQDGVFPKAPVFNEESPRMMPDMDYQAFYEGRAAMGLYQAWEIQNLQNRRMYDPDNAFDWDVVTYPVLAEAPNVGPNNIWFRGAMAINRNSQHADAAWDFIAFHNSEKMLKIKSREHGQFVSVREYNQAPENGPANLDAFFALKPPTTNSFNYNGPEQEKIWGVYSLAEQQFTEVLNGNKSVQDFVDELQTKGQEMLNAPAKSNN